MLFFEQKRGNTDSSPRGPGSLENTAKYRSNEVNFPTLFGQKRSYPISFRGSEKMIFVFNFRIVTNDLVFFETVFV